MARDDASKSGPRHLALELFALTSFAIAQPLFDILGRTPEFLLVRHTDALDVVTLVLTITFGPAIALCVVEMLAGALGRRVRIGLHVALLAVLSGICLLPPINRHLEASLPASLGLAGIAGALAAGAYSWSPNLRAFLQWTALAGVVFPAVFLLRPSIRPMLVPHAIELGPARGAHEGPIVMVVFDEFPAFALTDATGQIDAALFPNFARLAREGTWFRNATTIASVTQSAVAGIVTGASQGSAPVGSPTAHSRNLFTLLGAAYELDVTESYVPFCPDSLCGRGSEVSRSGRLATALFDTSIAFLHLIAPPAWAARLPELAYASLLARPTREITGEQELALIQEAGEAHWKSAPAERATAFERFIASIGPSPTPVFHYLHILVPHMPYVYESSGRTCADSRRQMSGLWWLLNTDSLVMHQRLLMQVGWVDWMVGRLIDRLERTGLYDRTLLVLVADHGISFREKDERRALTATNGCDVLGVPLFIKKPHQRDGGVSDRNVEVIDVLPTIASVVGTPIPWPVAGQSAFGPAPERPDKTVYGPSWPSDRSLPWKDGRLSYPANFGTDCLINGRANPGIAWGSGTARVFRFGAYGDLVGHVVRSEEIAPPTGMHVEFTHPDPSEPIAPDARDVPCVVEGSLSVPGGADADLDVVVAVNGTIAASGRARAARPGKKSPEPPATFMVPVPASAFHPGSNDVQLFVPRREDGVLRLLPASREPRS